MLRHSGHRYRFLTANAFASMALAVSTTGALAQLPPTQQPPPKGESKPREQVKAAPAQASDTPVDSEPVLIESDIQTMEGLAEEIRSLSWVAKYTLAGWATPKSVALFHRILDDIEVRRGLIRDLGTVLRSPKFSKTKEQDARITRVLNEINTAAPIAETFQPKPSVESLFPKYGSQVEPPPVPEPPDFREQLLEKINQGQR